MPGHKRILMPDEAKGIYGLDITEIDGFDNLHDAKGILLEAQRFAAELYGSEETKFVVNGSTAGILAAIGGTCRTGGKILVARNCHKAVYHALEINRLQPIYIYPEINEQLGINEGINIDKVSTILQNNPDVQAFILTSPTYDGVVSDIEAICKLVHAYHIPLIVDEAHGAHFHFHSSFPVSAVELGADLVIQSVHKTLPAMTQTAILHMNGDLLDRDRVRRMLTIYQTSSPSYVLMGSIDSCMHMLHDEGEKLYKRYVEDLIRLRECLSGLKHIHLLNKNDLNPAYSVDYDISKLVLSVKGTTLTGPEFHTRLLNDHALQMEMCSLDYILAMTTVGDSVDGFNRMLDAAHKIDDSIDFNDDNGNFDHRLPELSIKMSIDDAGWHPKEMLDLDHAVGRIAGDYIYLYPPGIPLVTPGEWITEEVVGTIRRWIAYSMEVTGIIGDGQHPMIQVIK